MSAFRERSQRRVRVEDLARHLAECHGTAVTGLQQLDAGVFRVARSEGQAWVARLFPADRPLAQVQGDAEILSWLADCGYPAERPAGDDPVSSLAGQGVLVTEWVEGVGCRGVDSPELFETLADLLGRLHTLPVGTGGGPGALSRPSGAWHSLSLDGGGKAADLDAVERLFGDLLANAAAGPGAEAGRTAALERVRSILREVDTGEGLPVAVTHPDFATPNAIRRPDGRCVLVDWTGAGTGPRVCSLGLLLWVTGGASALVAAVARGYGRHVTVEEDERRRLGSWCRGLGPVLAAWSIAYQGADPVTYARRMPAGLAQAEKTAALFCAQLDT